MLPQPDAVARAGQPEALARTILSPLSRCLCGATLFKFPLRRTTMTCCAGFPSAAPPRC